MNSITISFLIFCIASSGMIINNEAQFLAVTVLNDDNFEELTQMNSGSTTGRWFVKFYAPVCSSFYFSHLQWCGHCKKLAPVWEELADMVEGELNIAEVPMNSEFLLQVDATENDVLSKLYNIEGFPTLFYFYNVVHWFGYYCRVNMLFMKEEEILIH